MALLPYALRPTVIIRGKALRQGVLGSSLLWKAVAAVVFGRSSFKKFFGKQPESLGTWKVGTNKFVSVVNAQPMTKKQRTRAGITREMIVREAVAVTAAARPNARIVVKKK